MSGIFEALSAPLFTVTSAGAASAAGVPWLAGVTAGAGASAYGVGTAFTLSNLLSGFSTILSAGGALQQGAAQRAAGQYQAQVGAQRQALTEGQARGMEQQAGQERAVAQRAAIERRREGRLVGSRAQALAAASGAGALDPTIVGVTGDIDRESELRALTALYQGEERARGLEYGATLQRAGGAGEAYAGEVARRAGTAAQRRSYLMAGGRLAAGFGSYAEDAELRRLRRLWGVRNPILSGGERTLYGNFLDRELLPAADFSGYY